ncbi:MAG: flagellar motor switch protein FliM [Porticoccaceae bacterium]|nr:flagellar motor switch protein FliM [Porticoccaceae bacterium]
MTDTTNLLSPEELDALAAGIEDGTIESNTGINTGTEAVKHDLTNEDSSLGVNVAAIDMINERFVRQFRAGLLEVLRTTPKINMAKVQIIKYSDYLADLTPPLAVETVRFEPLQAHSLVCIDPSVVFSSLDNFFGGFGRGMNALPPGRTFTPTEKAVIGIMINVLFGSLQEAWAPVMPIKCEHVSSEINPAFAQIADGNDLVVVSRFTAELSHDNTGNIDLVYPYNSLKPLREALGSRVQTGDDYSDDTAWRNELDAAAADAEVPIRVVLAETELSLREFKAMQEGDVLYLKMEEYARMMVDEIPVLAADIGSSGPNMAAKVVKAIEPET